MDEFENETGQEGTDAAECACSTQCECEKPKKSFKEKISGIFKKK